MSKRGPEGRVQDAIKTYLNSIADSFWIKPTDTNKRGCPDIIGDIKGKNVIMVDDMISTGGTVSQAAKILKSRGAKDVYLCATHPVFCGGAIEKLEKAKFKKVIVTDTIPPRGKSRKQIVQVLSVAGLLSEAIRRIHNSESISSLFI